MRNIIKQRGAHLFTALAMFAVFAAATMLLWNAFLPGLFGLPVINYWQAVGLLALARILFGGFGHIRGHHGHGHHGRCRGYDEIGRGEHRHGVNRLREKWMNMSDDERREFIKKEKEFFKANMRFSGLREFFRDDEEREDTAEGSKEG